MRFAIKYSLPVTVLILLAASAVGMGAVRMIRTTMALRAEARETETRLTVIAARKRELSRRLAEQDAPEAVEYQAKAQLNLKNPGEVVVVVAPEENKAGISASSGLWQRIRDFFSRIF